MQHKAIIREILEGRLLPAKEKRMVELLLRNPQFTQELLSQHQVDLALRAIYGSQNRNLEAAVMATITGTTDDQLGQRTMTEIKRHARLRQPFIRRWALPLSAAAAVVLGLGWFFHTPPDKAPVATLVTAVDAQWAGPVDPAVRGFTPGPWKLVSGVAELRTSAGATVTLQGPSEFTWRSAGLVDLQSGMLQATVPPQASGFTVRTSAARIVDIGTRFGVRVDSTHPTEVHVFEGHVQANPSDGSPRSDLQAGEALAFDPGPSGARRFAADPSLFPQSSVIHSNLLNYGECEPGDPERVGVAPFDFGVWGGDGAEVIGVWNGVKPHQGRGMLRLTGSVAKWQKPTAKYGSNEQWQFIDLSPFADAIDKGRAVAEASMWIRQVHGQPVKYRLFLAGFKVKASAIGPGITSLKHPGMTAISVTEAMGEPEATSWRRLQTQLKLPPGTRLVYVNPRVSISGHPDPDVAYLLDSIEFKLAISPLATAGK